MAMMRESIFVDVPVRGPKGGKAKKGAADEVPPAAESTATVSDNADIPKGKDLKSTLKACNDHLSKELSKLRGATASPNMLDSVMVEAYGGESQPLTELAQISLKNPQLLMVNPFDSALSEAIAKAISNADLNLNPSVDGQAVRVPVPKSSKETREQTVKLISKLAETAKTRIRRARQAELEKLKKMEKQEGVSEDEIKREVKAVEDTVAAATAEAAKIADKKKLEIEAS